MSSTTEQIKERLPVEDVISSYIKLEKSGKNLRARCPFHNEKTPSFFVSPDRGTYYCFGCGVKGDIFTFVSEFEGLDFRGALKVLADKAGVEIEKQDPQKTSQREKLFQVLDEAALFFQKKLLENKEALDYLSGRGLDKEISEQFRIGYAPEGWRELYDALSVSKRFNDRTIHEAGLVIKKEDGGYYDRFRGRIIFPLFDPSGRVIAFTGRIFPDKKEEKVAKYVNSPETELFHKSRFLYGYHVAKSYMRKYDFAIVVEGQTDLLAAHKAGYKNAVATSGTSLTKEHFELINRLTHKLVLALDGDGAGESSAGRGTLEALKLGMDVKVAKMPTGQDPAELILSEPQKWKEAIKNSLHIIDFYITSINERGFEERKRKNEIQRLVLPFLKAIDNKIDQGHFVKKIALELSIREEAVYEELAKIKEEDQVPLKPAEKERQGESGGNRRKYVEERLRAILLWQENGKDPQIQVDDIKSKLDMLYRNKFSWGEGESAKDELMFQAEMLYGNAEDLGAEVSELVKSLEEDLLREEMAQIMTELRRAESEGRSEDAIKILEDYQKLLVKLAEIKEKP